MMWVILPHLFGITRLSLIIYGSLMQTNRSGTLMNFLKTTLVIVGCASTTMANATTETTVSKTMRFGTHMIAQDAKYVLWCPELYSERELISYRGAYN